MLIALSCCSPAKAAAGKAKNTVAKAKNAKKAALQGTKEHGKRKIRTSVIFRRYVNCRRYSFTVIISNYSSSRCHPSPYLTYLCSISPLAYHFQPHPLSPITILVIFKSSTFLTNSPARKFDMFHHRSSFIIRHIFHSILQNPLSSFY
jgi:hypothetical protein